MDEIGVPNKPIDSFKKGGEIKHISGNAGGYLVGQRHSEGGIKAINKSTGQPLEMEGGEVVITRNAVSSSEKHEFEGQMLTNREILSKINESGGGVSFEDGGEVCHVCDAEYNYKGKKMKDVDIFKEMAKGGEIDDILKSVDDLSDEDFDDKDFESFRETVEALEKIQKGSDYWEYCFVGMKNTKYENKYFMVNGDSGSGHLLIEVFTNKINEHLASTKDILDNFRVLPKDFEIYNNNFNSITYKSVGRFQKFTLGVPTRVRANFLNKEREIFHVDASNCVVVTDENRNLFDLNNPETTPETTNQQILDTVTYFKTLLPQGYTPYTTFQNRFAPTKFFRAYVIIHRENPNSEVEFRYFILYGKTDIDNNTIPCVLTYKQRDAENLIYALDESWVFSDVFLINNFSNIYNLDIVVGYRDCYENIDLNYIISNQIPVRLKGSEDISETRKLVSLGFDDDTFGLVLDRTEIFDLKGLADPKMNNFEIYFGEVNTEKERKYIESRIKELGLKIKLFRASMTLEEFGSVQRELRRYVKTLQDLYLEQKNSNPMNFFERIKEAIQVDFGNINAEYQPTKNLSVNGLPSQLTEEEWLKVRTEDFKIWFGDWEQAYYDQNYSGVSKIIDDATKEPLAVYHGTNVKFVDWKVYESNQLHYFAKKREMSEWFARAWETGRDDKAGVESAQIKQGNPFQGTYLYRCFLNIKNPIDFSPFGVEKVKLADLVAYLKIKYGVGDFEIWSKNDYFKKGSVTMESKIFTWQIIRLWQNFNTYVREFTPYDGFIFYEYIPSKSNSGNIEDASLSFCAFKTEQIKFHDAISFSPNVDDSRFEQGGQLKNSTKRRRNK